MNSFQEIWQSMSTGSKLGLGAGGALILMAAVVGSMWVFGAKYETLFSALDPRDASSVVSELEKMKVPFKLDEGGARITVPVDSVHEIRLKLMGTGIPLKGGVGFEVFDNTDFGMTEFAQKINYQRALEGELTRTINSLEEVKYSRVHLVMPENTLFRKNGETPTASVILFMKEGGQLPEKVITGVQRMVAASVPGLEKSGVTVADQQGVTMSRKADDESGIGAMDGRLEKKRNVETYLAAKVVEVLEGAFGPGQAQVSVDATLDMDQRRTTREQVLSADGKLAGVVRKRESISGGKKNGKDTDKSVVSEVEYQVGRQLEQVVGTPGDVTRLSIGVLVPRTLAAERMDEIRSLVSMAIGLDEKRGDAISVFLTDSLPVDVEDALIVKPESPATAGVENLRTGQSLFGELTAVQTYVIGGGIIGVFMVLILILSVRKRETNTLSVDERARVLAQLNQWLEQDASQRTVEVKS